MTSNNQAPKHMLKAIKTIQVTEEEDRHVSDGRPRRALLKYGLEQLPGVFRHFPSFLRNKRVNQVNPKKHYVWLFDNIAFRASSVDKDELDSNSLHPEDSLDSENAFFKYLRPAKHDPWQAEYTAAFFKKKGSKELAEGVARFCQSLSIDLDTIAVEKIQHRIQYFVDSVLPRHVIQTSFGHRLRHLHGPSSSSGISSMTATLPTSSKHKLPVVNRFPGARNAKCFLAGTTIFAEPEGWGIISDIDDTIKVTLTDSSLGILQTTFLEDARAIPGMPELYASLDKLLAAPPFFYVSASPYNLYPYLRQFREDSFPFGQIMLRENTWQTPLGAITLLDDVQKYKVDRIRKIHSWFPRRQMVLIGDSTHKDPETYAEIARMYPGWIRAIFIRRVTGVNEVLAGDMDEKNSDERMSKAFEGLDEWMWFVFDEPGEVLEIMKQMVLKERVDSGVA